MQNNSSLVQEEQPASKPKRKRAPAKKKQKPPTQDAQEPSVQFNQVDEGETPLATTKAGIKGTNSIPNSTPTKKPTAAKKGATKTTTTKTPTGKTPAPKRSRGRPPKKATLSLE